MGICFHKSIKCIKIEYSIGMSPASIYFLHLLWSTPTEHWYYQAHLCYNLFDFLDKMQIQRTKVSKESCIFNWPWKVGLRSPAGKNWFVSQKQTLILNFNSWLVRMTFKAFKMNIGIGLHLCRWGEDCYIVDYLPKQSLYPDCSISCNIGHLWLIHLCINFGILLKKWKLNASIVLSVSKVN